MKTIIIAVFSLLFAGLVWAEGDECSKNIEVTADTIVEVLEIYKDNCLEDKVARRLSRTSLETDKEKADILMSWEAIIVDIDKDLENLIPAVELRKAYQEVRERSISAKKDAANPRDGTDRINMAEHNYWQFTNAFILVPVEKYNYEMLPLKPVFKEACESEGDSCPGTLKQSRQLLVYLGSADKLAELYSSLLWTGLDELMKNLFAQKWNTFLYDSKPMYPLDIIATDLAYRFLADKKRTTYRDGFHAPPEWQVFFLHPAGAFQYIDKAEDGQQFKAAVYAEIIGVNNWDNPLLGFTGFSLIASYSDRKDTSDVGWGGLITYDNVYSFGVTSHSGDVGYFVSIDLANLLRDKVKSHWDKYKK